MVKKRDSDPNQLIIQWEAFIQDNRYDNSLQIRTYLRRRQRETLEKTCIIGSMLNH